MEGLGEQELDLNFEDLEFTNEEASELEDEGNTESGEESENNESGSEEQEAGEAQEEIENNDEATEGRAPDIVSGDSTDGEGTQSSPKLYHSLASTLIEKGVLSSVEDSSLDKIENVDDLVNLMKDQIKKQELDDLTPTQREVLTGIREGAELGTVTKFKNAMDKLDAIDDKIIADNQNVRQDLIYQDYMAKGFSKEAAIKQVNRSVKLGEDIEDANEAHRSLITTIQTRYKESKDAEVAKVKDDELQVEKDKKSLEGRVLKEEEVFKGYKTPEATRKEILKEMTDYVSVNPDTKSPENSLMKFKRENPEEYTMKLYHMWKLSNGFKDLEYFKGKDKTSSVKDLENAIKNSTHIQGGGDPSYSDDINTVLLDIEDLVLPD